MFRMNREIKSLAYQVRRMNELLDPVIDIAAGDVNVRKFYFGHEEPKKVVLTFSLSNHEWCQLEKSGKLDEVMRLLKGEEHQSST